MPAMMTMRLPAVAVLARRDPAPFPQPFPASVAWLYPGVATGDRLVPTPPDTQPAPLPNRNGRAGATPYRAVFPQTPPRSARSGRAVGGPREQG
jgi:hypothetical protein